MIDNREVLVAPGTKHKNVRKMVKAITKEMNNIHKKGGVLTVISNDLGSGRFGCDLEYNDNGSGISFPDVVFADGPSLFNAVLNAISCSVACNFEFKAEYLDDETLMYKIKPLKVKIH